MEKINPKETIRDNSGNTYVYDPNTEEITLNGALVSEKDYEPVFINSTSSDDTPPIFSGIFLKKLRKIIGLNGKINNVKNG